MSIIAILQYFDRFTYDTISNFQHISRRKTLRERARALAGETGIE